MKFTKMQGVGNDYVYIDCFSEKVENPESLSRTLSDRHFGVGADGIVLIKPSLVADCFMDIYNADGSRAKMCGNAVRCVAKYIYTYKKQSRIIKIDTLSGIRIALVKNDLVSVNMGAPILNGRSIPTRYADSVVRNKKLNVEDKDYEITCLSMGNPHCVIFCRDVEKIPLQKIGQKLERHEMFPEGINVEFTQVISPAYIKMRVWERGSGETLGCGTGACAVAVASVINGFSTQGTNIEIKLPGGMLTACWKKDNNVYLTGEAVEVYRGSINI